MKDPGRERSDVLENLAAAAKLLERSVDIRLIPEKEPGLPMPSAVHGIKMVLRQSREELHWKRENHMLAGPCVFGAEESIARIVLTVMKFDPRIRCVATLRFSEPVLRVMRKPPPRVLEI